MSAVLLEFPDQNVADVPSCLRALADAIERGEYGDAHCVAWVVDCGNHRVEIGLAGTSPAPGAEGHLLFGIAMKKLEGAALGDF